MADVVRDVEKVRFYSAHFAYCSGLDVLFFISSCHIHAVAICRDGLLRNHINRLFCAAAARKNCSRTNFNLRRRKRRSPIWFLSSANKASTFFLCRCALANSGVLANRRARCRFLHVDARPGPFNYEKEDRLKQFSPSLLRVLITLLADTGLRVKKEALPLKWYRCVPRLGAGVHPDRRFKECGRSTISVAD